jgi:hypothetical protein
MDSVLKVYCLHTEPNFSLPWQRKRQYPSSSSGFIVSTGERKWILTNAHSVDYHTQVGQRGGGGRRRMLLLLPPASGTGSSGLIKAARPLLPPAAGPAGQGQAARRRPQVPGARRVGRRRLRHRAAHGWVAACVPGAEGGGGGRAAPGSNSRWAEVWGVGMGAVGAPPPSEAPCALALPEPPHPPSRGPRVLEGRHAARVWRAAAAAGPGRGRGVPRRRRVNLHHRRRRQPHRGGGGRPAAGGRARGAMLREG